MRTTQFAGFLLVLVVGLVLRLSSQSPPKLIVVVVVDQMRADYLDRFAGYETGGLHFFATHGARFLNANYEHMPTETCVGHSVLLSGRNPVHTGIVANEWYDRDSSKMMYCVGDANSPLLGDSGTAASPNNFSATTSAIGYKGHTRALAFSISLKDRAAVLMGGHHPQGVFWFSHETGSL